MAVLLLAGAGRIGAAGAGQEQRPPTHNTVQGMLQTHPGAPVQNVEVDVHEAPVGLPTVAAAAAPLQADDLVLGVVIDGQPMAYPIRYLALFEVVNDHVGATPVAPTW